jgi:hypothetical protein
MFGDLVDYPYTNIAAQDTAGNPISIMIRASSDSPAATEADIINGLKDYLTGLPGVTINSAGRFTISEIPV